MNTSYTTRKDARERKEDLKGGDGETIVIEHQKHTLMGRDSKQQWRQGLEKGDQQ